MGVYNDICLANWYSLACACRARGAVREDAIADLKPEASTSPLHATESSWFWLGHATDTSPAKKIRNTKNCGQSIGCWRLQWASAGKKPFRTPIKVSLVKPPHCCRPRLLPTFASKGSNLLGQGSQKKARGSPFDTIQRATKSRPTRTK